MRIENYFKFIFSSRLFIKGSIMKDNVIVTKTFRFAVKKVKRILFQKCLSLLRKLMRLNIGLSC